VTPDDYRAIVLLLFVVYFCMLWAALEAKSLLCLTILLVPGFILVLTAINITWGPTIGDWFKSFD
jgi:hypothetical protein